MNSNVRIKKILLLSLCVVCFFVFAVSCGKKKDNNASITVPSEVTVPTGELYTPSIVITPDNLVIVVEVLDPDGNNVVVGADYSFTPSKIGDYIVKVTSAKAEDKQFTVKSVDGTAPVITTSIEDKNDVELGNYNSFDSDLATMVAEDNVDGATVTKKVSKFAFGDEVAEDIENGEIVLNKVGVYTIYGYVEDNSGNKTEFTYKINTKDTTAPVISGKTSLSVWVKDGKVTIPDVVVEDASVSTEWTAKVYNSSNQLVTVTDNKFSATEGTFTIKYVANDGYNDSEEFVRTVKIVPYGTIMDFEDEAQGDLWDNNGVTVAVSNGKLAVSYDGPGTQVWADDCGINDWTDFGYLSMTVKNNNSSDCVFELNLTDAAWSSELIGTYTIPANTEKTINAFFRMSDLNTSAMKKIFLNFTSWCNVEIDDIILKNMPDNFCNISAPTTGDSYVAKTYEKFEVPSIVFINGIDEEFIRSVNVEVVSGSTYTGSITDGFYFENVGDTVLKYMIQTKTGISVDKQITVKVEKGEPKVLIQDLPLGMIGETAKISKYLLANMENPTLKVYYTVPGSDTETLAEGSIAEGYSFVPSVAGNYSIKFVATDGSNEYIATDSLYVKGSGEMISYESNNGLVEGISSENNWGNGCDFYNTDLEYVYAGKGSMKYVLASGSESGTTYQNADKILGAEEYADVIQFMIYSEKTVSLKIYMETYGDLGPQYGYSGAFTVYGNQWNKITMAVTDGWAYGDSLPVYELEGGITGLSFKNVSNVDTVIYVDSVYGLNHENMVFAGLQYTEETLEVLDTAKLPVINKYLSLDSNYDYTDDDDNVIGIRAKIYKKNDEENFVDVTGLTEYAFSKAGTYVYEVYYQVIGTDYTLTQEIVVNDSNVIKVAVNGNFEDMVEGEEYTLPSMEKYVPSSITGEQVVSVTAQFGDETAINIEDYNFTPSKGGDWTITYSVVVGNERAEKEYTIYVRNANDMLTFEKFGDASIKGFDQNTKGDISALSINNDSDYVLGGNSSLKFTYDYTSYGKTTAFSDHTQYYSDIGIRTSGEAMGYTNSFAEKVNCLILNIYTSVDTKVVMDVGGKSKNDGNPWSKVYDLVEGWNTIEVNNQTVLESGHYDFSEGIKRLMIANVQESIPTENFVLYVDNISLTKINEDYVLQPGEFISFESLKGVNNGFPLIDSSTSFNTTYELSKEWAAEGEYSVKVTFDRSKLQPTTLQGASKKSDIYFGNYDTTMLGIEDAHIGHNAFKFTVNVNQAVKVILGVKTPTNFPWSKVYSLEKGVNTIRVTDTDTLGGNGTFGLSDGVQLVSVSYLCYEDTAEDVVMYMDYFRYYTYVAPINMDPVDVMNFDENGLVSSIAQVKSFDASAIFTINKEEDFAHDGGRSLCVTYLASELGNFNYNSNWEKYINNGNGFYGVDGNGDFIQLDGGKDCSLANALSYWVYSEVDTAVLTYTGGAKWGEAYSTITQVKANVWTQVIVKDTTLYGPYDFTHGVGRFTVTPALDEKPTDDVVLYIDSVQLIRINED